MSNLNLSRGYGQAPSRSTDDQPTMADTQIHADIDTAGTPALGHDPVVDQPQTGIQNESRLRYYEDIGMWGLDTDFDPVSESNFDPHETPSFGDSEAIPDILDVVYVEITRQSLESKPVFPADSSGSSVLLPPNVALGEGSAPAPASTPEAVARPRATRKTKRNLKTPGTEDGTVNEDLQPKIIPFLEGQQPDPNWKKGDGIREPDPPLKSSGLIFDSYNEAFGNVKGPAWLSPAGDNTIPHTSLEQQAYVKHLLNAMTDLSAINDKTDSKVLEKRWLGLNNGARLSNSFYGRQALERLCWTVVGRCYILHTQGPGALHYFEPSVLERSFKWAHLTYQERIDFFVRTYRGYKARIDSALLAGSIDKNLLIPGEMLTSAEYNRVANDRRQEFFAIGRPEALKQGRALSKRQTLAAARAILPAPSAPTVQPELQSPAPVGTQSPTHTANSGIINLPQHGSDEFAPFFETAQPYIDDPSQVSPQHSSDELDSLFGDNLSWTADEHVNEEEEPLQ
ncbi:hypothetical protein ACN47E_000979 [Coniothyrium glycines]